MSTGHLLLADGRAVLYDGPTDWVTGPPMRPEAAIDFAEWLKLEGVRAPDLSAQQLRAQLFQFNWHTGRVRVSDDDG